MNATVCVRGYDLWTKIRRAEFELVFFNVSRRSHSRPSPEIVDFRVIRMFAFVVDAFEFVLRLSARSGYE